MTSTQEPNLREFDDKDEKSNDSLVDDEENALPSEHERDTAESNGPKATPPQSNDPGPVPNGGLQAWLQVAGAYMVRPSMGRMTYCDLRSYSETPCAIHVTSA